MRRNEWLLMASVSLALAACGGASPNEGETDQDFTSDVATLLSFELDGELLTTQPGNPKGQIRGQLLYSVGLLNGQSSVARLDKVVLTNIAASAAGNGLTRISYHAKLPVAWGSKTNLPSSWQMQLPRRVDAAGLQSFFDAYQNVCADFDGDTRLVSNYWFHYRPLADGCSLSASDAINARATVSNSPANSINKYPEYHRVWEDRSFDVVAVFGKYAKGDTGNDDAGIAGYNAFVAAINQQFPGANLPDSPGAAMPETIFKQALPGGRSISVAALLVDEVRSASLAWQKRYAELTAGADLIVYNGHAGLGSNVAALANMGAFFPAKYQIIFFDGCDTFAYTDDTLANRRALLNPTDPTGTRYMDIVTNAMPAYFMYMPDATMALIRALVDDAHPKTYPAIFHDIDAQHVVVVNGEEDNVYSPQAAASLQPRWANLHEEGFVAKGESVLYTTDLLPAGTYSFQMTADPAVAGGDADLRVRAGAPPTADLTYKCKGYNAGTSNEKCTIKLSAPSKIYVSVTGDKLGAQSHFELRAWGG